MELTAFLGYYLALLMYSVIWLLRIRGQNLPTTHPPSARVRQRHSFCKRLCTQHYIPLALYSISQACIESSLYKLNALAFITQKIVPEKQHTLQVGNLTLTGMSR